MLVFVAWPTASVSRSNETAALWMAKGYKVAVATELPPTAIRGIKASVPPLLIRKWEGYYAAMNALAMDLVIKFRADIVIAGGDMIMPPQEANANTIGSAFAAKFPNQGMGVMLPCGDPWKPEIGGGYAQQLGYERRMHATPVSSERCEGAWLGRRFILERGGGFNPGYHQYFGDVELHDVSQKMGVLFKTPVIRQERIHWSRPGGPSIRDYQGKNFDGMYEKDYALWRARRYKGYPGTQSLLIPTNAGKIILPHEA